MFRTRPGEERALIEDWINRPALRKLVEAFGGTWPTGTLEEVVARLVDFSEVWDYRAGTRDRHMFHDDQDQPDPHAELTYWAAEQLGMINPPPPSNDEYDYLVILGGLATGVEPRVRYAARLVQEGLTVQRQIAALGSFRPLADRELPISTRYVPDGRYEIDHLDAMLGQLFQSVGSWETTSNGDPAENPAAASRIAKLSRTDRANLATYAAASSDPARRPANTVDTYVLFAEANSLQPGDRLLVITSSIYLPYQHLDAVRSLRHLQVDVETVGVIRGDHGPVHPAAAYRQEVRSTVRSADLLVATPSG